ncbi:MAG: stage II sporulation protein M [Dehalococcoidales bacterium]|jgi:stage II sporulation protein M|nr:stage II sporulation protein M [Dehalococcoidales bacterium]NLT28067.1 stage II sporulation protein M [Dehalococcoidales bacterium]
MKNSYEVTGTGTMPDSFWHNFPDLGIKKWVIISSVLFSLGLLFGVLSPGIDALASLDYLMEIADSTATLSSFGLFLFIIINNVFKMILSFVLSPLLCIFPILSLVMNGWIISNVGHLFAEQYSVGFFMLGILPHGIIEIPAFIIGQAAALSLGSMAIAAVFIQEKRPELFQNLRKNLKYIGIVIVLLIIAAGIEAFITPSILGLLT